MLVIFFSFLAQCPDTGYKENVCVLCCGLVGAPRLEKRVVLSRLQDPRRRSGQLLMFNPFLEESKKNAIRVPKKCGIHTLKCIAFK